MAAVQIRNGQQITSTATEQEIQIGAGFPYAREIKFRVTSGNVQVTTGPKGASSVIGGEVHAYGTGEPDFMTIEPAEGRPGEGTSMYIKGSGTIFFSF